jgi:hypothetical protein
MTLLRAVKLLLFPICYAEFMLGRRLKQLLPLIGLLLFLPILLVVIPEAVRYIGRATGTPANLLVDADGFIGPMPRLWRNLAQGGEEHDRMLDDVGPQIRNLQTEYVRIDHIYDLYEVVQAPGVYDWSRLDLIIGDILNSGAKPYIALSYMPPALSKSDIVDLPRDWNDWEALVKATVEHISGRNGLNISGVYYEVWNEPDLFGGFRTYGPKNYLDLYFYSARGAQRAQNVNRFKIGGPATTALYLNWANRMLEFAAQRNLPMDFISWHRYDYNLDVYEKDVQEIRLWLEDHPEFQDIEFHVTEWGHDPEIQAGYDTTFAAAHTIAATRAMMGTVDRAFVFEIKDGPGPEKYWGRWGLLTHEKWGPPEAKPRYRALEFLNTLADERISVAGEGSWVKAIAARDFATNRLQTLIVNYDPRGSHTETVPITFENLPSGNFLYSRTDFLGQTRSIQVATTSATWATQELMRPNSAAMLTLTFE